MKVDVVYEKEMMHLYVLSSIGGLVLLLLIFLVLYKVGTSRWLSITKTAKAKWGGGTRKEHTGLGSISHRINLSSPHPSTDRPVRLEKQANCHSVQRRPSQDWGGGKRKEVRIY